MVVLNSLVGRFAARHKTRFEGVSQTATRQIAHKTAVKRSGGDEEARRKRHGTVFELTLIKSSRDEHKCLAERGLVPISPIRAIQSPIPPKLTGKFRSSGVQTEIDRGPKRKIERTAGQIINGQMGRQIGKQIDK